MGSNISGVMSVALSVLALVVNTSSRASHRMGRKPVHPTSRFRVVGPVCGFSFPHVQLRGLRAPPNDAIP